MKTIRTEHTMSQSDMDYVRARDYQQRHHLSLSKAAIKRRIKTWRQMEERIQQNGATGADGIEI